MIKQSVQPVQPVQPRPLAHQLGGSTLRQLVWRWSWELADSPERQEGLCDTLKRALKAAENQAVLNVCRCIQCI